MGSDMTTTRMTRRNLFVPDPLWSAVNSEAKRDAERLGREVSAAEWVRVAIEERLARVRGSTTEEG